MKYGAILYNYEEASIRGAGDNLGDHVQTIALLELYKKMGIPNEEILMVGMQHLHDYDGEYVVLPIIGVGVIGDYAPPYSDRIIPVFISTHFVIDELTDEQVRYIEKFAPVGCRDEWTLNIMRRYHLPAYLSGCITVLMGDDEHRDNTVDDIIYCIDVPDYIKPYVDNHFKGEKIVYDTHLIPFIHDGPMSEEDTFYYLNLAKERVKNYANAKVVISSRMHALLPAIANRVPVIGVFENISYRFSWLDKYIRLYTEDDIEEIEWNPDTVTIEKQELLYNVFDNSIRSTFERYNANYTISEYYEDRSKAPYGNRYRKIITDFFNKEYQKEEHIKYMIFGCGLIGSVAYNIIQEQYPDAEFLGAIDNYVSGIWKEKAISKPQNIDLPEGTKVIIASFSGRHSAFELMERLKFKENSDYIYIATTSG